MLLQVWLQTNFFVTLASVKLFSELFDCSSSITYAQDDYVIYEGGRIYLKNPYKYDFSKEECPTLSEGKRLSIGSRKSACVVEGPKGRGSCNVAVVLDSKFAVISSANFILRFPQLPLLVNRKANGRESYFPMELCYILENQRVKQKQQTAVQIKEMRKVKVYFKVRKHEILTQDLKLTSVMNVIRGNKSQTLENIVNKLNIKLGGLNYTLLSPDRRLVCVEVARGGVLTPTVVGYAANSKNDNYEFVGDFGFHDAQRTEMQAFPELQIATYFKYQNHEVPLIRKGLVEGGCDPAVKVTMIVVNRMHNIRIQLDPRARSVEQNCKPGTVLDEQVVHPRFSEFYLNSHKALQGTSKTPRYTVVVDDSGFSLDDLEMMTYALCYCHQIVNSPTSIPAPLYIATRYAERGRRVINSESAYGPRRIANLRLLNEDLPYYNTHLAEARINA
ncbi:unnamed protein product [Enterobius vermicularis]|uniref:Piwi domain-containing protein n=1 Tax=Enterobius vermicularis TaxID=51028 RepID=A0A3P6HSE3_ENTVE|nr:unnamed protein product [Enterobius vermicularis]